MQFNRTKLDTLVREKIKEVNDEAGYREYLEVPEMVEIVASIIEQSIQVMLDSDAELIHSLREHIETLENELEELSMLHENNSNPTHKDGR